MLLQKANEFIKKMYEEENLGYNTMVNRLMRIKNEISQTGTYTHTTDELVYGAKVAWRNSNRCIGRLFWDKLEVRDLREVDTDKSFIDAIEKHIIDATNGGKIKPIISIFSNEIKLYNEQLIRYAGYGDIGDPISKEITDLACKLGEKKEEIMVKWSWLSPPLSLLLTYNYQKGLNNDLPHRSCPIKCRRFNHIFKIVDSWRYFTSY